MELRDYQHVAVEFLRGRDKAALMLDMGLGKTACVLTALEERHLPALVVAPKRIAEEVWDVEQELWRPDLTLSVAMGDPDQRKGRLASDSDIVVISRDNLADVPQVNRRKAPFRTLIIDELSGFKNKTTARWKNARRLASRDTMRHVWGLTGTPVPNGYLDLWGQIALLDNGDRLGKNLKMYRNRYFDAGRQLPNGVIVEWNLKEHARERINERIEDIALAMTSEGRVELPETILNEIPVRIPEKTVEAYKEFEKELIVDLSDIFDGDVHTASGAAALSSRLSQMTSGFVFVDDAWMFNNEYTRMHTVKLDALQEVVESPHEGGVLVFYRFTPERDMIKERFGDLVHFIDEPGVIKAWNRGEIPILLAHPASAGHGLNLQFGGHTIVWTTPTWDLEFWDQGNKRLSRPGQKHPVVIHVLVADNVEIDSGVLSRCTGKSVVQKGLLSFLESPI